MGELYLLLLKTILLPLIITAILWSVASPGTKGLGKVGAAGAAFYALSSLCAALLAITLYGFFMPGFAPAAPQETAAASGSFSLLGAIATDNLFEALAEGHILPVVVFTLFFAAALWRIEPALREHLSLSIRALYEAMMTLTGWVIWLTPAGAFSLVAVLVAKLGAQEVSELAGFVALVIGAGLFHALISLPLLGWLVGRFNPWRYLMRVKEALMVAFVTASSAATLPVSMRASREAGVRASSSGLLLPLGATLNMDGSALYHALLALFLAHLSGVELVLSEQMMLVGIVMLSSAGTAAIPGGGIAMMAFVLSAFGIDPVWLGLYLLIDRLLDNYITTVNVWGDLVALKAVDTRLGSNKDNGDV